MGMVVLQLCCWKFVELSVLQYLHKVKLPAKNYKCALEFGKSYIYCRSLFLRCSVRICTFRRKAVLTSGM